MRELKMHTIKKALYILPILVAGLLPLQKTQAQNTEAWPTGTIQIFQSQDKTPQADYFNSLKTQPLRVELITQKTINEDWTNTIPYSLEFFNCQHTATMYLVHSVDWINEKTHYNAEPIFDSYSGKDPMLIHQHKGSLADKGMLGFPTLKSGLSRPNVEHEANVIVTGDDLTDINSYCFLDAAGDSIYKPHTYNWDRIEIYYPYTYINQDGKNELTSHLIMEFKSKDGVVTQTYNINNDPFYADKLHVIEKRDTVTPKIKTFKVTGNILSWDVEETNPREMYYTYDGGQTKIPLSGLKGTTNMSITTDGKHTVKLYIDDYFNLSATASKTTNIDATAPIINAYTNSTNDSISWNIIEDNFKSAWYTLDNNNTQTTITQTGKLAIKDLTSQYGSHTINFYAKDQSDNTSTNSKSFSIATSTSKQPSQEVKYQAYPNPVRSNVTFAYPENSNTQIQIYDITGKQLETIIDNDKDGQTQFDMTNYTSGAYIYKISTIDNYLNNTQTGKLIKE